MPSTLTDFSVGLTASQRAELEGVLLGHSARRAARQGSPMPPTEPSRGSPRLWANRARLQAVSDLLARIEVEPGEAWELERMRRATEAVAQLEGRLASEVEV